MSCIQACQEMITSTRAALLKVESAMAQLQQLEENATQEKALLQQERAQIERDRQQIEQDRQSLKAEKSAMVKNDVGPDSLVGLNFRGEKTIVMKRSVLCQIEGSMLAAMFSGRYENHLDHDKDGNVYVGYPPSVMMPLMDWLTACQEVPPEAQFPTVDIPKGQESMWDGVVKFLGLQSVLPPPSLKMFSGVQRNIKLGDLEGWVLALCKHCTELTTMGDFSLPGISWDSPVLVGAKKPDEDTLLLAAIGRHDVIATQSNPDRHHNGVFWTFNSHVFALSDAQLGLPNVSARAPIFGYATSVRHEDAGDAMYWSLRVGSFDGDVFEKIIMVPKKHASMSH